MTPQNLIPLILILSLTYFINKCCSFDSITASQPLRINDSIVSKQGTFKLGFFSPPNTTNRYLGIWYNKVPVIDVVWVANRLNPLNDSSGIVRISEDGNLQLLNGLNETLWSTSSNVSQSSLQGINNKSLVISRLLDTGNLVLLPAVSSSADNGSSSTGTLWQSFEHPADTILPSMTVTNKGAKDIRKLGFSWKSPSDPAYGRYSLGFDSFTLPEVIIYDGDIPHWRSGPWNGNLFIGIPYNNSDNTNSGFTLQSDRQSTISLTYSYIDSTYLTNYEFAYDGTLLRKLWVSELNQWVTEWGAPQNECDLYGKCGVFGICNQKLPVICQCQKGFQPANEEEWMKGNWSRGCVRKKSLQCSVTRGTQDGFFRLSTVKVPAQAKWSLGLDQNQCRDQCTKNCSCIAYAFDSGAGCMSWDRDLVDTQTLSGGGVDLYLRLNHSELAESRGKIIVKAVTISIGGSIVLLIIGCLLWKKYKERGKRLLRKRTLKAIFGGDISPDKLDDLPLFELERLQIATNSFHENNQLGRGGFGPVYKGKLEDGQEIAVKRLSQASGQGTEEFVNEVKVISKLQHRNLVKLLGCCVEGEEKMLIYEYMPNKSLDAILFDEQKRELLPWTKRFNIIDGICRGILYLHRDSRLRIIHRDLKTSNILLDENLNPKISDFGMARIFGGNEDQADTRRVVGTYGYMPPEYAMGGRFSEKSDVFSFGVLLLEIVSGTKNSQFWHPEDSLTLLGYAWKLWKEGNIDLLIDKTINEPAFKDEILTCVKIGLLCVQEFAKDRPNISTVIPMLSCEAASLPSPKKPAFSTRQDDYSEIGSSVKSHQASSINDVSITIISTGR